MKKYFIGFCIACMPLFSMAQLPLSQADNETRFIEGGIGSDESDALRLELKNWPLLLEFSQENGNKSEWISNVVLVIKSAAGLQVLSHQVDGPLILIDLKPGRYSAESIYDGRKIITNFGVEKGQHKKIDINWR